MNEFTKDEVEDNYLVFEITNVYELFFGFSTIFLDLALMIKLLFTIRYIIFWAIRNVDADPLKLLCINCILLLSVICNYEFDNT
jgi:hypothetical protein